MSKLAQSVQQAVDQLGVEPEQGETMAMTRDEKLEKKRLAEKARRDAKKAAKTERKAEMKKARASQIRTKKPARQRKTATRRRFAAGTTFVFVKRVEDGLPRRAIAVLNAAEKIGSGSLAQIAAKIVKSDYDGKQDLVRMSAYFLGRFAALGAVSVAPTE
mgnify:CR=1 FL=1